MYGYYLQKKPFCSQSINNTENTVKKCSKNIRIGPNWWNLEFPVIFLCRKYRPFRYLKS